MPEDRDTLDEGTHTEGAWAGYNRSASRYGRRHHDTDRWAHHQPPLQDRD